MFPGLIDTYVQVDSLFARAIRGWREGMIPFVAMAASWERFCIENNLQQGLPTPEGPPKIFIAQTGLKGN